MNLLDLLSESYTPDTKELNNLILSLYSPAVNAAESDELLSTLDILESLRETDPELTSKHVYDALIEIGFKPCNLEDRVYWPVIYT